MKKINLTNEKSNTVHVDDVKVEDGIYCAGGHTDPCLIIYDGRYSSVYTSGEQDTANHNSLRQLISEYPSNCTFYHIPTGKQITTEKELTLDDLKDSNHIGFVDNESHKGYIASYRRDVETDISYMGLMLPHHDGTGFAYTLGTGRHLSVKDVIRYNNANRIKVTELYLFDTRKELYKWLSE